MQRTRNIILFPLALLILSACADNNPPTEEISDSQNASIVSPPPRPPVPPSPDPPQNTEHRPLNTSPAPVYRSGDNRPGHDDAELARQGIHRVDSKRLILYSDLPHDEIAHLPALVDALYHDWIAYFGELPPQRDGGDYQLTGYLIKDEQRFRRAGLVPEKLPYFEHGLHRGRRFWMRAQTYDFYQEHLLLHEATHCFMMELPGSVGPVWYMEGMAEYFGLHRQNEQGGMKFGVVPPIPENMLGFDRIEVIRDEIAADNFMTLDDVARIRPNEFTETRAYAWSWAACLFFNKHLRYQERFRALSAPALRSSLQQKIRETFASDAEILPIEWAIFAHEVIPNYDFERTTISFPGAMELKANQTQTISVAADRSWQPTGIQLNAHQSYMVSASGEVILNTNPRPWHSGPAGITFDYAHSAPLGTLQAAILVNDKAHQPDPAAGLLSPIDIGTQQEIIPTTTGHLYLRINDHPNNLANNQGAYRVKVEWIVSITSVSHAHPSKKIAHATR